MGQILRDAMPMHVRISEPQLLPDLIEVLLRNGCIAQPLGHASCRVIHVDAHDPEEARHEVLFFIRAWRTDHPGVDAIVTP
jgi:hypothetical protein